jgi:hypothetical protein
MIMVRFICTDLSDRVLTTLCPPGEFCNMSLNEGSNVILGNAKRVTEGAKTNDGRFQVQSS